MNEFAPVDRQPRTWPTVIGVLGVLWGGIGLASGLWSLVVELSGNMPASQMAFSGPVEQVAGVLGLLVASLLLVGSIQLLRRKPMGIRIIRAWIPLSLLVGLFGVGLFVKNRDAFEKGFLEAMKQAAEESEKTTGRPAPMPIGDETFASAIWVSSAACSGVMALLPPLVPVIFVYGRRGREAMSEWSVAGSPWQMPQG